MVVAITFKGVEMVSIKSVVARAVRDTVSFWGGWQKVVVAVILILTGFTLHYLYASKVAPVKDEALLFVLYTLAPVGLFTTILFLWNVVAAPFRIEKERRISAEKELSLVCAKNEPRAIFAIRVVQDVWGGLTPTGERVVLLALKISNMGQRASALTDWCVKIIKDDGKEYLGAVTVMQNATFQGVSGTRLTIVPEDMIYTKTQRPISSGQIVDGYILSLFPPEVLQGEDEATAVVSVQDVFGGEWEASCALNHGDTGRITYLPGTHGKLP